MQGRRRGGIGQPASPGAVTVGDRRPLYLLSRSSDRREWPPLGPPAGAARLPGRLGEVCSPTPPRAGKTAADSAAGAVRGSRGPVVGAASRGPRSFMAGAAGLTHLCTAGLGDGLEHVERLPARRSAAPCGGVGLATRRLCRPGWDRGSALGMLRITRHGLEEASHPKRWRSKEAKQIVAAVQRAGGQVERTASGHLKVIGPAGSAIVASAPNSGRAGGRAVHNTLATIRSKTGLAV